METITEKATIETGLPGNIVIRIMGNESPADIEARETYLNNIKTIRKIINARPATWGSMANATPNKVATPFPPLNPAKTGKIWPITAAIPKAIW